MPGNGEVFEAVVNCTTVMKREWFTEGKERFFKIYAVDNQGVYHTMKGLNLIAGNNYSRVLDCLNWCVVQEHIK